MRLFPFVAASLVLASVVAAQAQSDLAPTDKLRAAYLSSNPTQAVRNPQTGEVRGPSYELAQELARKIGKPLDFKPIPNPPAVVEAVKNGEADIGFVAYEATRLGTVEFSQTYMLVQQSFLVLGDSPIKAVADADRAGLKIAGTRADSITLCMKRVLKKATLVELENNPELIVKALTGKEIDALGANRQRLTALMRSIPGSRLLPDNFFNVPQNIVVPKDRPQALAAVDAFIDEMRGSGFLRDAIARGGATGVEAAPKSPGSQHGCPG
ncbi:transporter substrate-binding domain-containing protein [Rhodoplanes sp. Z2-YC6860]|uniref:transporter substrate-binding domain-containing protein n=1 Tax=Rhodoplanes sp. Z2-YC6860 TaxID=674703 RepID=UPI00078DA87F|nr:transporter substrate-binding domain-containing protein [Rhodoplanes sp. Z2-YC6860]AMN38922.1 amino acid ABC transporter substrate-binding protein [Rhodoplanes sp. Z2-YC6860]